jgi:probable HAF family extracellular repeat protein
MLSADDTDHLLLLPVAIAVALAVLAAPISEASPTPQSQIPGFLLDRGRYTTIEIQGARVETAPLGINDRGDIAGAYDDGKGDHGFMRDRRGRITTIDVPGARGTAAQKINNRGQIAGVYSDTSPDKQVPPTRGFLLDRGKFTRIDVPGAVQTRAVGINNRGQVVGEYIDVAGMVHGFLWDKGQFTTIDVPGAAGTSAVDINDRGQIVGTYSEDTPIVNNSANPRTYRSPARAPWCGERSTGLAPVEDAWKSTEVAAWSVYCIAPGCGARGPVGYNAGDTTGAQNAATRAWNTGVEAAASSVSCAALREARQRVVHLWDEHRSSLDSKGLEIILDALKAR